MGHGEAGYLSLPKIIRGLDHFLINSVKVLSDFVAESQIFICFLWFLEGP